ncbi:MAG TPA: TIGR03618 family F420-dependent PPOX class oxidoreductase [Gaiellaceae bacterium]|jgi:PPOX class probable F420-dependent enzyme
MYTDEQRAFLRAHRWGLLATGRSDGSPQQAMVGYTLDEQERVLISTQTFTAKWRNALRQPRVSFTVADDRVYVVIYGVAEGIDADPERAELSADVIAVVRGPDRPDPASIVGWLDDNERAVLRITPDKVFLHE